MTRILYETQNFYVAENRGVFEIVKNGFTHANLIGHKKTLEEAIKFADKAQRYPNNF
jgi:hypothetical protein